MLHPLRLWDWQLPSKYPEPQVPADNPMSDAKVELGMGGRETEIAALLASDDNYRVLAAASFPNDENPYSF